MVGVGDGGDDGEAQAASGVRRPSAAVEGLERPVEELRLEPVAVVLDDNGDVAVLGRGPDADRAARPGVTDRVVDEIVERLPGAGRIEVDDGVA